MSGSADPSTQISVLIVDDHEVVRRGVRAFLDAQPDLVVIAEATDGATAVGLAAEHRPAVALVDLVMPEIDGVETTRQIKRASPATQVVVLTSYHDAAQVVPAIRAGALSYLLKDITPEGLAAAVRRAAVGEAVLHPRVATQVTNELRGPRVERPNLFFELTERELEVLQHIAEGESNAVIADGLFISEKTVKRHVSNILSKLHLSDRTQAAVLAWKEGFVRR